MRHQPAGILSPANSTQSYVSLRLKLTAALGVALVILLVGVASLYALRQSTNAAAAVEHSEMVRVQLERALTTIVNAETGQRGYLITQDTSYLAPYAAARTDLDREIASIRALTADSPLQQSRIDSLALIADAKLVTMNETVVLTQSGNRDSALKIVMTGRGAALTRPARNTTDDMETTQAEQLAERINIYNSRKLAVTLVTVVGSLLGATLSILTMLWLRSGVRQLEEAKDTIEEQSAELADELATSHSLADKLAASNDELQRANVATESARGRFEQLLQSTDEAIFGIDADGLCTFINASGARLLGYERNELLGRNMHEVSHHHHADGTPYPIEQCPIHKAMLDGTSIRIADEVFWTRTGRALPVEYTSSPIASDGRTVGAVIAFNDITARRNAERERERLIAALARSNQELDQFAYVASHDLKAPLRGIANLSQWIEEDLGENVPPDVSEKMTLVRGRVQRLEALIDGILQYSRAGRMRSGVEDVDVELLLKDVVELLAPPPEVVVTIEPGMPTIRTERTPLQQVFMNLINNAIKYNRHPGARITVSSRDTGNMHAFSVTDNGPGIEPEYHERIFGIFQTLESRDRVEGTGIGLSVVKKTVELHGGSITVRSALGEGATFTFEWPKSTEEKTAA
jgi:PAS domain S-box-containing protein